MRDSQGYSSNSPTGGSSTSTGRFTNRRKFLAAGAATLAGALAGCSSGGDSGGGDSGDSSSGGTETSGPTTTSNPANGSMESVRMSFVPASATAPIWVAREQGYFEERGIELELATSIAASRVTTQLATGQLDISIGAVGASTFNAISDDIPISLVADEASSTPGLPVGNRYYIRSDLHEDGMSLADVETPVTIALNTTASVSEYMLARSIAVNDNLSWDNINVETMPFPQMISAIDSGAIDIAQIIDPLGPLMEERTDAEFIEYSNQSAPNVQIAGITIGGPFENQRRGVARRWLEAYIEGIRTYYDLGGLASDDVAPLVAEALDNPESSIRTAVPYFHNKNGRLWTDDILAHQEFLACQGYIEETVPAEEIFATDLLEEALDNIGRVPESEERVGEDVFAEWQERSPADWPDFTGHTSPSEFPVDEVCNSPLSGN